MLVELAMMISLITFLLLDISFVSALIIYCLYQFTFIFGGYLVRAETLVAKSDLKLSDREPELRQPGIIVVMMDVDNHDDDDDGGGGDCDREEGDDDNDDDSVCGGSIGPISCSQDSHRKRNQNKCC